MFEYQKSGRYFAQTAKALEPLAAEELREQGAEAVEESFRGVYFKASLKILYRINYCSRIISRVLAPLLSFECRSADELYKDAKELKWEELFSLEQTFAVSSDVRDSTITHSRYAALRLKDAIADRFRERSGRRPDVDARQPDLGFHLSLQGRNAVISLDVSGGSLHRRGYRLQSVEAPLQETLAAALVRLSGWNGERPLADPLCGSGTILAEALLHYCRVPAAFRRERFGFEHLPDFDSSLWQRIRKECDNQTRPLPDRLLAGSDLDEKALAAARMNLSQLPGGERVSLRRSDFRRLGGLHATTIITNPPYGRRLDENADLAALYKDFGDFLKQGCAGSTAFVLCGSQELVKAVGLKPSRRFILYNGPLECRLVKIDIY